MLTEDACLNKFSKISATSESIETVALWIIHHKDHHSLVSNAWFKYFRTANEGQRLSLLYLVNDVCQRTKNQKYDALKSAFCTRVGEAMTLSRHDEGTIEKVKRIITIWEERKVFKHQDLANFRHSLSMTFAEPEDEEIDDDALLDFEPELLVTQLEKYCKSEILIQKAQQLLPQAKFDFEGKLKNCLKDRQDGERIMHEIDEAHVKMSQFVTALEEQLEQHHRLIALLEQARSYYGQQLKDATTVEDAYQKFVAGIERVKSELEEMQQSGVYLGASPPRDAPSPQPTDDPFERGVEAAIEDLRRPGARDMFEQSDMDIDDSAAFDNPGLSFNQNNTFMHNDVTPRIRVDPRIERFAKSADASMAIRPIFSQPPFMMPNGPSPPFIGARGSHMGGPPTPTTPMGALHMGGPVNPRAPLIVLPPRPNMGGPPPPMMYSPSTAYPMSMPPPNFTMPPPSFANANGSTPSPNANHYIPPQHRSITDVVNNLFNQSDEDDDYKPAGRGANTRNLTVLSRPPP